MNSSQVGKLGEEIAAVYLKKRGYKILERNYSPNFISGPIQGEIDIIAQEEDTLLFVEVKTVVCKNSEDSEEKVFFPEDKVNFLKQRKIIKTSESYLLEKAYPQETKWQIDVITVEIFLKEKKAKIHHIRNAISDS